MLWWQWLEVKRGCWDVGEWKAGQLCLKIAAYEWGDDKIIPAGICDELITTELTIRTAGCVVNTDGPCEHCVHQEFMYLTYWSSWLICWNSCHFKRDVTRCIDKTLCGRFLFLNTGGHIEYISLWWFLFIYVQWFSRQCE